MLAKFQNVQVKNVFHLQISMYAKVGYLEEELIVDEELIVENMTCPDATVII